MSEHWHLAEWSARVGDRSLARAVYGMAGRDCGRRFPLMVDGK